MIRIFFFNIPLNVIGRSSFEFKFFLTVTEHLKYFVELGGGVDDALV